MGPLKVGSHVFWFMRKCLFLQLRWLMACLIYFFSKSLFIFLFLERGVGREKERERNIDQLPLACQPTTQACALTGN